MTNYILIMSIFSLFSILISINLVFSQINTVVYEDKFLGVKFQYPDDWQYPDLEFPGHANLIITYPKSCNLQPDCYPNISIGVTNIEEPDKFVLDDHVRETINIIMKNENSPTGKSIIRLLTGKDIDQPYTSISLNQTTLAGNRAIQHIYEEFNSLAVQNEKRMKVEMFADNKLYVISYTTKSDEEFKLYLPVLNRLLETFEIIPLLG